MFDTRKRVKASRNGGGNRADLSSILGYADAGRIRRTRTRIPIPSSPLGPIGSRWGILASEPASRETLRPPPASFFNPIPSMAGISSVTLDQFRGIPNLTPAPPAPTAVSPPMVPQEVFMDTSLMPPPPAPNPPIMTDGPVPPPTPAPAPRGVQLSGSGFMRFGNSCAQVVPSTQRALLPDVRINHVIATARASLVNDENRLIQSPWLSRHTSKLQYAPQSTSKLSVMEMFDKVCFKSKLVGAGLRPRPRPPPPPQARLEDLLQYFQ